MAHPTDEQDQAAGTEKTFPIGGGEVGELIRNKDWSSTPLGPVNEWPSTLRILVQNALNASFPMAVSWGEELYQVYNDMFAALMGDKHPEGLGRRARYNWSEAWEDTGPLFQKVLETRRPLRRTEMPFVIERHGFPEEAYFTFSYSPILEKGEVMGLMVTVTETTEQIVVRRRLQTLNRVGLQISQLSDSEEILRGATRTMAENRRDVPFALLYVQGPEQNRAELLEAVSLGEDTTWSPSWMDLSADDMSRDPINRALTESRQQVVDLEQYFGPPPDAVPAEIPTPKQALVVPIAIGPSTEEVCVGCFVFGLNPTIPFDDEYRSFLSELARNTSIAYANAREQEDQLDVARTRAELARQKAESRHLRERAQLLDSLDRPFYGVDRNWRIIYANEAARSDPHWSSSKVTGQNIWDLFPVICDTPVEDAFRRAMSEEETVELEFESPANGHLYTICAFPWKGGLSVTFVDITEARRAADALERSEARFRAVVEASLDVIAITDRESRLEFVSPAADEILGEPPEELLGRPLFELLSAEGACVARGAYTKLTRESKTPVEFRTSIESSSGGTRWLSVKARDLLDRDGVEGILLNIRDITEVQRYESELIAARERAEEMTRLKSSILTNMSHEIRTPLTSMIGMANVLADKVAPEHRTFAEKIERGGMRLSQTLDSVLTLAQIEGAAIDLHVTDVDVVREVKAAVQSLKTLASEKDLDLFVDADDEPIASVDNTFLVSILNNLIGNAIKFTEEGRITVRVDGDDTCGIIAVEDTGIGIDEEFLPHVFDEFRQESTGLARSHQGAGLGLTITRRMVEAMDGSITVCSTKGVGTTFTVTFPRSLSARPQRPAPDPADHGQAEQSSLPSVLVVEDDETIRSMLSPILRTDFEVTTVADAQSAIMEALRTDYDLVVLDIGLPDMDGVEALHHLNTIPGYDERPIVALTGYAMPGDAHRFTDEGFTEHIAKPFVPEQLKETLQQLI